MLLQQTMWVIGHQNIHTWNISNYNLADKTHYLLEALENDNTHIQLEMTNRLTEFEKKIQSVKMKQKELYNTVSSVKNQIEWQQDFVEVQNWTSSKLTQAENRLRELVKFQMKEIEKITNQKISAISLSQTRFKSIKELADEMTQYLDDLDARMIDMHKR